MRTPMPALLAVALCMGFVSLALAQADARQPLPIRVSLVACTDTVYTRQPVRLLVQLEVLERFQGCLFNLNEWSTRAIVHVNPSKDVHAPAFRSLVTGATIDDLPAAAEMRVYEAGYTQSADILVGYHYYDKKQFFAEPGEYEITVGLNLFAGHDRRTAKLDDAWSNPVHVTVLEPPPAEEGAAILWMQMPWHNGMVPHRKQALELIALYPNTTYADYTRFLLTRLSDYRWADWSIPMSERLSAPEQRALLQQVLDGGRVPQVMDAAWARLTELGHGTRVLPPTGRATSTSTAVAATDAQSGSSPARSCCPNPRRPWMWPHNSKRR